MNTVKQSLSALVIAIIIGWLGYEFYQEYQPKPERIQGQIEAQQYSISSKASGRVDKLLVKKGDMVTKGQLIFELYSPELEAKVQQAVAHQRAAGAKARETDVGARKQQIASSYDSWNKARLAAELQHKTYLRISKLHEKGVVSGQTKDEAYTKWQASEYSAQSAKQMYDMTKEGNRQEAITAANEQAQAAAGAVAEAEAYVEDLHIKSRYNGEVEKVLLQEGELVPQGFPVVTVIDMSDAWVVLHIREDKLEDFAKGTEFDAKIPALGEEHYRFRVTYLSAMGSYATWRATDISKEFDMRTFEVEARPVSPIKNLRAGMSVLVE